MAAYAALASLMNLIHDIQNNHSPPVSVDIQQLLSLSQILTLLMDFLQTPVADGHEYDPLEMGIANAAYAAEDAIESHILHKITHHQQTKIDEQQNHITFYQDLQGVIEEMDLLKQSAKNIDTEKVIAVHDQGVSASAAPLKSVSTAMVCSNAVLNGIMEKLTRGQVIPILEMGGIGHNRYTPVSSHIPITDGITQHQTPRWSKDPSIFRISFSISSKLQRIFEELTV